MKKTIILMMLMMMLVSAIGYAVTFDNGIISSLKGTSNSDLFTSGAVPYAVAIDSSRNLTYVTGASSMLFSYNSNTNISTNISDGFSFATGTALAYDSSDNILFIGDIDGNAFAYFPSNNSIQGISFGGIGLDYSVKTIKYVSSENSVYFMGEDTLANFPSSFKVFRIVNWDGEDVSSLINSEINGGIGVLSSAMEDMEYDSDNNALYFVSQDDNYIVYLNLADNTTGHYNLAESGTGGWSLKYFGNTIYYGSDYAIGLYNITALQSYRLPYDYGISQLDSPFNNNGNGFGDIGLEYDSDESLLYYYGKQYSGDTGILFGYLNISSGLYTNISNSISTMNFPADVGTGGVNTNDLAFDSVNKRVYAVGGNGDFWVYQFPVAIAEATPETPAETPSSNQITGGAIYTLMSESGNGLGLFLSAITHPIGSFIFYIAIIGAIISLAVGVVYIVRKVSHRL